MKLTLNNVSKQYGKVKAVQDLSIELTPGIYGFLGPNGAGKSTTMKLLVDAIRPSAGDISLDDTDIYSMGKQYRKLVGYMPQQQKLYPFYSGYDFLCYVAALKGMDKKQAKKEIDIVIDRLNLRNIIGRKIKTYSGGMKQRLLLAQALLDSPKILLLDEPTAGLDPKERIRIRNYISEIATDKIVIIATHVVQDIEYISKELIFIKEGCIISQGIAEELLQDLENSVYEVEIDKSLETELLNKYKFTNLYRFDNKIRGRFVSKEIPEKDMFDSIVNVNPNLEDYYLFLFDNEELIQNRGIL